MGFGSSSLKLFGLLKTNIVWIYVTVPLSFGLFLLVTTLRVCVYMYMYIYVYDKEWCCACTGPREYGRISIVGDTKNWTGQSPEQHGLALGGGWPGTTGGVL